MLQCFQGRVRWVCGTGVHAPALIVFHSIAAVRQRPLRRPVSVGGKIPQSAAFCQASGLGSCPQFSCGKHRLCWAYFYCRYYSQHYSFWQLLRQAKKGRPYGPVYRIESAGCLGRFLRMSNVGRFRPDFISAKSMGIWVFISRSRNKTLIPGDSVCIASFTECHRCAQRCEKHWVIRCCHRLSCSSGSEAGLDLQTGRLGPPFQATDFIFTILCERK